LDRVEASLEREGLSYIEFGGVRANPELPMVREGIELCIREKIDFILAVGGGSVIDSAKDIANGAANPETDVWDFSLKKAVPERTLPKGVVLTLAAAGSEMSESCVITNPETNLKRGYNSRLNRVQFAIENPELTYTVSRFQTACGAVDIAMHTMERYFSPGEETYLTDALAEGVMKTIIAAGKEAVENPESYQARANMMWASSLAHNDLTGSGRRWILPVHQLEHELSGLHTDITHAAGLSALWCSWARYSYTYDLKRFVQFAVNIWGVAQDFEHPEKTALEGIRRQEAYYKELGMPTGLKELGIKEEELETLAEMCSFGKTRELPAIRKLACEDMLNIYRMAYEAG
ncbi:MAG: iron-containing alcohol dehydrogenase, partial [Eubacteriales bacterium]|nr:iron-containing alcohol dehydrogenase [Eubacteriales bacterium]